MNHTNGRLILKVKKRRISFPVSKEIIETEKENIIARVQKGQKRANPFTKNLSPSEKLKLCNIDERFDVENNVCKNSLLFDLERYDNDSKKIKSNAAKDVCTKFLNGHDATVQEAAVKNPSKQIDTTEAEHVNFNNETKVFPLDWSIKHRIRFFSKNPFKVSSHKAVDECKGIHKFSSNVSEERNLCQSLYNWTHPSIPGIPNFPLKTKTSGGIVSEDKIINTLSNSKPLQECAMKQWRNSFQSLYNMLKTEHCSYFYMCTYQFTIVFKAVGICEKSMSAVMGPTTKGLRDLLTEEGIPFEFTYEEESKSFSKEIEFGFDGEQDTFENGNNTLTSLNTSYEEDFLDSIGLNRKDHFPSIEAQQRLSMKSRLRSVDNRPESTIRIKNCQGLFNFLLNANFLCSPSGVMEGVPPTLISPSPFEGGTLCKCKISNGPIKQQKKSSMQTVYCIDVNGVMIPEQIKGLVDLLTKDDEDVIRIQMKTFDMLHCLNGDVKIDNYVEERTTTPTTDMISYLRQKPVHLNDNTDIVFADNLFKF